MGGSVAVILKHNNKLWNMCRRTGTYQSLLFDMDFHRKDPTAQQKAVNRYLKNFKVMRQDFLSGEPYNEPMSDLYGAYENTYPEGYGMVYIDSDKKEIHSIQGYDSPGEYSFYNLFTSFRNNDKAEIKNFKELFEGDFISVKIRDKSKETIYSLQDFFASPTDSNFVFEDIAKQFLEQFDYRNKNKKQSLAKFKESLFSNLDDPHFSYLKLKDWNMFRYEEQSLKGLQQLYTVLAQSIAFTPKDQEGWLRWIEECVAPDEILQDCPEMEEFEKNNVSEVKIAAFLQAKRDKVLEAMRGTFSKNNAPENPAVVQVIKNNPKMEAQKEEVRAALEAQKKSTQPPKKKM